MASKSVSSVGWRTRALKALKLQLQVQAFKDYFWAPKEHSEASQSFLPGEIRGYAPLWTEEKSAIKSGDDVSDDDGGRQDLEDRPWRYRPVTKPGWLRCLIILLQLALICVAIWGAIDLVQRLTVLLRKPNGAPCYCGTSVAEAESLGCKYVEMAAGWLPPHCRDEQIEYEFAHLGPNADGTWNYYSDPNRTQLMTYDEVARLGDQPKTLYYTSWEWHIVHCLSYWRKLHRAQSRPNLVIEPRYNTDSHILHCSRMIWGPRWWGTESSMDLGNYSVPVGTLAHMETWEDLHKFENGFNGFEKGVD
ncbi:hypothetical protein UCRPC4_g05838 [Phaeomoniella chlamydospora]|uniref:Uncharacterized protein n=1 Tax=Phaeomoniella chlamydospora TaxID=158046 RepID=A0A0G2E145_PHACM|nr:hypothetical protein UCRPC4_g05838 [Phaeomoniella chlamydospora]